MVEQIVNDFNSTLMDLIKNVALIRPRSIVGRNVSTIEKIINQKNNKNKAIEIFVAKVLIYKDKIDKGDESFFMQKHYDKDLDGDQSLISSVFEFKKMWSELSQNNKNIVIQFMQLLCLLAQNYFMVLYGK